ncbi:MAG: DUF418 domain-containing protein [Planctomycetota bacterium]
MTRFEHIDALRGFALFGILFGNATWFSGTAVMPPDDRAALGTIEVDNWTRWLVHTFVDGKFYSLFSLLFGVGFALVMQRDSSAGGRFRRRMIVLLAIGALHASLLWFGDIVSLYAVTGLLLPRCWRMSDRAMLRCSIALMLAPVPISLAVLALRDPTTTYGAEHGPQSLIPAFATGTYPELVRANWAFLVERWVLALESGRFCKLLGLFLLGAWLVRRGVATDPGAHRDFLARMCRVSLVVAIPSNLALAWFLTNVPAHPPSLLGCARTATYALAAPSMCFVYASTLSLCWRKDSALRRAFAAAGRMSLTHYVTQSIVGATVFYGVGLGLWGRWGDASVAVILPALFAIQTGIGVVWLHAARSGPLERMVRRMSPLTTNGCRLKNASEALERDDATYSSELS